MSRYPIEGRSLGITIEEDYAYVASYSLDEDYRDGVVILDISDPTNLIEVGYCDSDGGVWDSAVSNGYAYVANYENGIEVFDLSDITNPTMVFSYFIPGGGIEVKVSGQYLYAITNEHGLFVFDISYPDDIVEVGFYDTYLFTTGMDIHGNFVYVADHFFMEIYDCFWVDFVVPPARFTLLSPLDSAVVNTLDVELSWSESSDADDYMVVYSEYSDFLFQTDTVVVSDEFCQITNLRDNRTYWWKVLARNNTSSGRWSHETCSFDVNTSADVGNLNDAVPIEFAITSAYPNPFNPKLNISISLPQSSSLKVSVYNVMGQRVATLTDGKNYSVGIHNFVFNSNEVISHGSGVYFIHASSPNHLNQIQKVILMK